MAKTKVGNVKGPQGEQGVRGSEWRVSDKMTGQSTSGTAFPGAGLEDSIVNDVCLNPVTFDLYRCQTAGDADTAEWVWECNIKGPQGDKGEKGDPTTVDAALSATSTNPVQNKVVNTAIADVRDSLSLRAPYITGVKDLNAIPNTFCFFMTDESPVGKPAESGVWFVGLQFRLNDRWMTQVMFSIGSVAIYMRAINNGNNIGWKKLIAS